MFTSIMPDDAPRRIGECRIRQGLRLFCAISSLAASLSEVAGLAVPPDSPPGITITDYSLASGASLVIRGTPDHAVRVEAATNLIVWIPILTTNLDETGDQRFVDAAAAAVSARFYRAVDLVVPTNSSNVVGFVNLPIPGRRALIAHPFLASNNTVSAVLPGAPNGISLYKVAANGEPAVNNYVFGWSDPAMTLLPGEGALLEKAFGSNFVITFKGEVVQGTSTNYLPGGKSLCSSVLPQAGALDVDLGFPTNDFFAVSLWTGIYAQYDYDPVLRLWNPEPPQVGFGEAFWLEQSTNAVWPRDLTITLPPAEAYVVPNHALNAQHAKVNFMTYHADPAFGRVFDSTAGAPLGSSFSGQLYAGTSSEESSLTAIGHPVSFGSGAGAGYIRSDLVPVMDLTNDQSVCLQLRVWETARGSSYEIARANGGRIGQSEPFWADARNDFFSFPPSPANGFVSFSLTGCTAIVKHPLSQTRPLGGAVSFSVDTIAVPPRYYQWWHSDGTNQQALGTNRSITLTNLTWADAGSYWVVVSNAVCVVESEGAILTLFGPPEIGINGEIPAGHALTTDAPALVELISSLTNGYLFYTLDGTDPADGWWYLGPFEVSHSATIRAVVYTEDFTHSLEAVPFSLTILRPPVITRQPRSLLLPEGGAARFDVVATGDPPPSYQWQFNGADLPDATNATLILSNVQSTNTGSYVAVVTNAMGTLTSAVATLTVRAPPSVTIVPGSTNVPPGVSITFHAEATGSAPLIYQWRKNGVNIPGATNEDYTIPDVQLPDGGSYSVVVANEVGAVTSDPVLLLIQVPGNAAPPGDHFTNRVPLGTNLFATGTNHFATREPDEPLHAGKFCSNSVWYTWQAPASGIATFRTLGSTFDTLLGIYTNDLSLNPQPSILNLVPVASDEDRGGFLTSEVEFNAVRDVEYAIAVDGFAGQQGTFILSWELTPTSNTLPVITTAPQSRTVIPGSTVTFSVAATGPELSYQWYFNEESIAGATSAMLVLPLVQPSRVGFYIVAISNRAGVVWSLPAALELGTEPGPVSQDKMEDLVPAPEGGAPAPKWRSGSGSPSLPYYQVGAGAIGFHGLNNVVGTTSPGESNHCGVIASATRWLYLSATNDGTMVIEVMGTNIPTVMAVYFWLEFGTSPEPMACGLAAAGEASRVRFAAYAGSNYAVVVDGLAGTQGSIDLNWALGQAPEVTAATTHYVVKQDSRLELETGVSGGLSAFTNYQWYLDGWLLDGATGPVLLLNNVQSTNAGLYSVIVSNAIGVVWHDAAQVQVDGLLPVLIESLFENGNDGWRLVGGATNLTFDPTNGNPGGCLVASSRHSGGVWYWAAPARYGANWSAAYGGWLQFDLRESETGMAMTNEPDVILKGGGLVLVFDLSTHPGSAWISYKVPLHEGKGWMKESLRGSPPSQAEMLQVLSDVTELKVRGQFTSLADSGWLDNVAVVALETNNTPLLQIRRLDGNQLVLEWPANALDFQPESAADLTQPLWSSSNLPPATVTEDRSLKRLVLPVTSGQRYFRLQKR